jgi:uncharacterized protein YndB with AHSA1/START domain
MINKEESNSTIVPISKSIRISLDVEAAYKLFTEGINSWWPLDATHSVGKDQVVSCAVEGRVGGRVYETLQDGSEAIWGTIQAYEPPHLFATSWHPGNSPEVATYLEVRFAAGDSGTTVTLTHSGWEARGEEAASVREGYNTGWDFVLGEFTQRAGT